MNNRIFFPLRRLTISCCGARWSSWPIMCNLSAWMVATGCLALLWTLLLAAEGWPNLMSQAVVSLPSVSLASSPPSLCSDHLLLMWRQVSTWRRSVQRQWPRWAACQSSDRHWWHQVMVWCHVVPNSASNNLQNYSSFMGTKMYAAI